MLQFLLSTVAFHLLDKFPLRRILRLLVICYLSVVANIANTV